MSDHLNEFQQIMRVAGLDECVIRSFTGYYRQMMEGATGKLGHDVIVPPDGDRILEYSALTDVDSSLLRQLVVVKLNGGLGTSMGLSQAKSLLPVKPGLTFLDIIARQILHLRAQSPVPLLFMDSYNTREDTLRYLERYPDLTLAGLPLDFVQNKFPRIRRDDYAPLNLDDDRQNWNPPGHGDIYVAMRSTGILNQLLENGYRYLFVSNADNLGAVPDERILAAFARSGMPFLMEVCLRTPTDRKGGHLAQTHTGRLLLREAAQCPDDELDEFQDIDFYRYFNTNNLWIDLIALKAEMDTYDGALPLSMIVNPKEVGGIAVYQIETAMGSALSVFENAGAVIVPRDRFAPVKKTDDLLSIWSDAYVLTKDDRIVLAPGLTTPPVVKLDERYYKTVGQLTERCAEGVPSLQRCNRLEISGDIHFGPGVECEGDVTLLATEPCRMENEIFIGEVRIP